MARAHVAPALILVAILAVYALRLDEVAGLMIDDAWYLVLAKALSLGEGFRLINSAATPILPAVPPGFPALLAPVFLVMPAFPDNVFWLKLISMASIGGVGIVCWLDFTRHRGLPPAHATLLVGATLLVPALVFLATSTVMSECVFMLAQVVALVLIERLTRAGAQGIRSPLVAGTATAVVVLVRTAGIALVVAALVYLVLARRFRQAAVFAAAVIICLGPWLLYSRAHTPSDEQRIAHGGGIASSYGQLLTRASLSDPRAGSASLMQLAERAGANFSRVLSRDLGAVVLPSLYRGADESGLEVISIGGIRGGSMGAAHGTMFVSLLLSAIVVFGWLGTRSERFAMPGLLLGATFAMIAPVGGQTFRYLVPLAPYVMLFLWHGLRQGAAARIAIMCVVGFQVADHASYIYQKQTAAPEWIADARENDELLGWMVTNLKEPGAVASTNPELVYLRTGRKSVASVDPPRNWSRWKEAGIRYIVSTDPRADLPRASLGGRLLYRTSRRGLWIVEM